MSATWNPIDKFSTIVLSNGNLTVTATGASDYKGVRATNSSYPKEKYYYEVNVDAVGNRMLIGIANNDVNTSVSYGTSANNIPVSVRGLLNTGIIYQSGVTVTGGAYLTGDVIGITFDTTLGELSFYKNGNFLHTASGLDTSKEWRPYTIVYSSASKSTTSFIAETMKIDIPPGFLPYEGKDSERKVLLLHNNTFYGYDTTRWISLGSNPTESDILLYGLETINTSQIQEFETLYGKYWEGAFWTDGNSFTSATLNATPVPQILTAKNSIQLTGVETASFNWTATGGSRVALSVDNGASYYAFKSGSWVDVTNNMSNAMSATEYSALTWEQYRLLAVDSNFLKHQYYIPDNSTVDDILITAELMGSNIIAPSSSYQLSYDQSTKTVRYTISKSGSFFANVLDV